MWPWSWLPSSHRRAWEIIIIILSFSWIVDEQGMIVMSAILAILPTVILKGLHDPLRKTAAKSVYSDTLGLIAYCYQLKSILKWIWEVLGLFITMDLLYVGPKQGFPIHKKKYRHITIAQTWAYEFACIFVEIKSMRTNILRLKNFQNSPQFWRTFLCESKKPARCRAVSLKTPRAVSIVIGFVLHSANL